MSALGKQKYLNSIPDRVMNNFPVDYKYARLS